jgi:hypothetical protein
VNLAMALFGASGIICFALVLIVRMVLESQDRGKGRDIAAALDAAQASASAAEESARHALNAKATVDEMQGALTALSIRMGLRGQPQRGYPGSEPPAEPKV